ncbi:MAG: VCBS repeat-containing protein [bacterium]|nr:VCBS repeat-containing protein [bacterium]
MTIVRLNFVALFVCAGYLAQVPASQHAEGNMRGIKPHERTRLPALAGGCADSDGDTVCDEFDNCPNTYNPDQRDSEGFGASPGNRRVVSTTQSDVFSLLEADFDGDGDLDLLSAGPSKVTWYERTQNGFGPPSLIQQYAGDEFSSAWAIAIADLNVDGRPDVVVLSGYHAKSKSGYSLRWFVNRPHTSGPDFELSSFSPARDDFVHSVDGLVPFDADGDGDLDLLFDTIDMIWIENFGGGNFGTWPASNVIHDDSSPPTVADVDGDGLSDVLHIRWPGAVLWQRNLGAGVFDVEVEIGEGAGSPGTTSILPLDFEDDGDLDLVFAVEHPVDHVFWLENLGSATFSAAQTISTEPGGPSSIDSADFDGDGDVDFVVSARVDGTIGILENLGGRVRRVASRRSAGRRGGVRYRR